MLTKKETEELIALIEGFLNDPKPSYEPSAQLAWGYTLGLYSALARFGSPSVPLPSYDQLKEL